MQETFTRVECGDNKYYLLTTLFEGGKNGFDLTVCNGKQIWRESVDSWTIKTMAKAADMSVTEFAAQTSRALTGQLSGQDNFIYQAKPHGTNVQFSWKKQIGDGIKFQLGSLTMSKVDDSVAVMTNIFDLAVNQMTQLKQEISSLRSDNARLSSERKDALKLLDKCVTAKEEMEKDLFEKFAAVLNDKKAKIRQLKELVNEAAEQAVGEPEQGSKDLDANSSQSKVKSAPVASRRPDDTDDETDDEKMTQEDSPVTDSVKAARKREPTSTVFSPSLLPEEETVEIKPTAKRRRRREPKSKESPAAKLVLPKVPSVKKTPSSSSGESITSSRSRSRRGTSDKSPPDADDLMAEMGM